jgi:regulatory protein
MALPPLSLKGRALRLLGTREHSRLELERKLARHTPEAGELARVLDELQAKGFIDARRVVESVVHRRSGKLGASRIRQELNDKGLDADLVRAAVLGLQATELERAFAVWRKKFGNKPSAVVAGGSDRQDATERARQMRFLATRGFSGDTIRRVVSGADQLLDDMPPE